MTLYFLTQIQTIMDKSLGTNLHLWRFFTRAEGSCANSSTLVQPFRPTPPPSTMLDTCTRYFSRVSTLYWGGGMHFEEDNRAFLKKYVFKTQKINAITQVSQGILSTIVDRTLHAL